MSDTHLVANADASVQCSHLGTVTPKSAAAPLRAGGRPVLVDGAFDGAQVATDCTNTTNSNTGAVQCALTSKQRSGAATKLLVAGKAALLDTTTGSTNGTNPGGALPAPSYEVKAAGQSKLKAR